MDSFVLRVSEVQCLRKLNVMAFDDRNIEWLLCVSLLGIGTAVLMPIISKLTNWTNLISVLTALGITITILAANGILNCIRDRHDS